METTFEHLMPLLFKEVSNVINTGVIILASDFSVVTWNKWVEDRSRLKKEDVIGKEFYSVVPGITNLRFKAAVEDAITKGRASVLAQSIHKSPLPLYSEISTDSTERINQTIEIQALRIDTGAGHYCLIQINSVDAAVKREAELRQQTGELSKAIDDYQDSEMLAQGLAEISEDSFITFDMEGIVESFNPRAEKMFGYKADEILGQSGRECLIPELNKTWDVFTKKLKLHVQAMRGKLICDSGWQYLQGRHESGRVFPVYLKLSILDLVDKQLIVGIVRDLTEIEASKQALQESKDVLELALECGQLATWIWDVESNQFNNESLFKLLGYTEDDADASWENIVHPDDVAYVHSQNESYLREDYEFLEVEYRVRSASGEWVWLNDTGRVAERDENGIPISIIGVNKDVNKRKQAELEAKEATDKLIEAARVKTEFLGNMSHELRTPMNGIMGILNLLETTMETEEQQEYISVGKNSANSLLKIIDDVLDFTKLGAQSVQLELLEFPPEEILKDVVKLLSKTAVDKALTIDYWLDESVGQNDEFMMTTDPLRLRQILTNLVGNAIKFTEQGKVQIRVLKGDDASFLFEVEDSGIGIPEDRQEMIFDAFSQADLSTTRKFGGTGLGLGISKELIELLGGSISVSSTVGEGSIFSFTVRDHSKQSLRIQQKESETV